jgi:hypothetical protein
LLHNHPHLSSEAGTIGQKWPQYKGLSPTPLALKISEALKFLGMFIVSVAEFVEFDATICHW